LGFAALTAEGLSGSLFQTLSHGIISPLLFLLVGVIYDRAHDRHRDNFTGLVQPMPVFVVFAMLAFFASMGIPGFSGFIAEILVILGAFKSAGFNQNIPRVVAILSTSGLFLSAAYYLYTARKMFFGVFWVKDKSIQDLMKDLTIREYVMLTPLLALSVIFGVYPQLLLEYINPAIERLTLIVEGK
jgi:NADH-quinone oxidoreductase subunit M